MRARSRGPTPRSPPDLHDRQADNWRPLLAIADRAGGAWPELARAAACRLSGAGAEPEQGAAVQLLSDLRALFARTGAAPLATTAILGHLIALEARPWAAYAGGQPLTPRQLATWLAGFQIRPKQNPAGRRHAQGVRPGRLHANRVPPHAPAQSVSAPAARHRLTRLP